MTRPRRVRVVIAFRATGSRLVRFVTGSFAVHSVLLAAVLIVPATQKRAVPIEDSMVVALAGPIAAAQAQSKATPHSAPVPLPAPPSVPKEARTVREVPLAKPKGKAVKPTARPAKETESESKPEAPPSAGPAGPAVGAGAGAAAVTATIGGGDTSLSWYGAAVKAALESAWIHPPLDDEKGTASVVVAFDIARDGTTQNSRVVQSSGITTLDRSALRAVIEASPLPAIPPTWTEQTIPVTMRFELKPETR